MESECAAETNQSRMKEGGREEDEREREGVREEGWKDGDSLQPWLRFDLFSLSFPGHSHSRSVSTRRLRRGVILNPLIWWLNIVVESR